MNVEIANLVFNFDAKSNTMISQLNKYKTEKKEDFFIKTSIKTSIEVPAFEPKAKSKYYDLYRFNDHIEQVQYSETKEIIGKIIYYEKNVICELYNTNIEVNEYLFYEYAVLYFVLKLKEAIFIHSSCFKYKDKGVLLIATSGTGKSTHARLWKEHEDIIQINDDKNILVYENNELIIYPNPFSGKHHIDVNMKEKLTHLVFVNRSKINHCDNLSKKQLFLKLMPHMMAPSFLYSRDKWNRMSDHLINKTIGLDLYCDISYDAVKALKEKLDA